MAGSFIVPAVPKVRASKRLEHVAIHVRTESWDFPFGPSYPGHHRAFPGTLQLGTPPVPQRVRRPTGPQDLPRHLDQSELRVRIIPFKARSIPTPRMICGCLTRAGTSFMDPVTAAIPATTSMETSSRKLCFANRSGNAATDSSILSRPPRSCTLSTGPPRTSSSWTASAKCGAPPFAASRSGGGGAGSPHTGSRLAITPSWTLGSAPPHAEDCPPGGVEHLHIFWPATARENTPVSGNHAGLCGCVTIGPSAQPTPPLHRRPPLRHLHSATPGTPSTSIDADQQPETPHPAGRAPSPRNKCRMTSKYGSPPPLSRCLRRPRPCRR